MAEREMVEINVYVSDKGYICMRQPHHGEDDAIICIHPDQAELLIKWLNDVKADLQQE